MAPVTEPYWKLALCWGTVITFLSAPLVVLFLQEADMLRPGEYKWMSSFYQSITALTFGLSGLRSVDRYIEAKAANGKHKET